MELLFLAVLSSLLTADAVIFGQFGFSRPIVSGPIIGFFLGDIQLGLNVGIILELIWINTIPIGASLVPDVTAATALTIVWAKKIQPHFACCDALIVYVMLFALPLSFIFRKTDLTHRRLNSKWNDIIDKRIEEGKFSSINIVVFGSFFIFIIKNTALFYMGMLLYCPLVYSLNFVDPRVISGLSLSYLFLPAIGIGVFLFNFYDSLFKILFRKND